MKQMWRTLNFCTSLSSRFVRRFQIHEKCWVSVCSSTSPPVEWMRILPSLDFFFKCDLSNSLSIIHFLRLSKRPLPYIIFSLWTILPLKCRNECFPFVTEAGANWTYEIVCYFEHFKAFYDLFLQWLWGSLCNRQCGWFYPRSSSVGLPCLILSDV